MKIVRVRLAGDEIAYGAVEPEGIRVHQGTPFVAWEPTEALIPFDRAHLLAPVFPTKVVGVGRNYADHAAERGAEVPAEPVIFLKPATAVIGPGAAVVLPPEAEEVHHEAELAVVVGRVAHRVAAEDAGGLHPRLHRGQRRLGPRPAAAGRAVGPGQGLRHLLPARPGHRDRARPGRPGDLLHGQRGDPPAGQHRRHGVRGGRVVRLRQPGDDPAPRRRDPDRHPGGDRAAAARGPHGGGRSSASGCCATRWWRGDDASGSASHRRPPAPCTSAPAAPCSTTGSSPATTAGPWCSGSTTPTPSGAPRSSSQDIIEGLRWLGLDWDEGIEVGGPQGDVPPEPPPGPLPGGGPAARGLRLGLLRLRHPGATRGAAGRRPRPPGAPRCTTGRFRLPGDEAAARVAAGEKAPIRFAVPRPGETVFTDAIRGELRFDHANVDDFVLLRSDGTPTYHLASSVDDVDHAITHIIRGEDLLPSTPKHLLIARGHGGPRAGVRPPVPAHRARRRQAEQAARRHLAAGLPGRGHPRRGDAQLPGHPGVVAGHRRGDRLARDDGGPLRPGGGVQEPGGVRRHQAGVDERGLHPLAGPRRVRRPGAALRRAGPGPAPATLPSRPPSPPSPRWCRSGRGASPRWAPRCASCSPRWRWTRPRGRPS